MGTPGGDGLVRRAGVVSRWPVGMVLASWRYLWRTTPVYREDRSVSEVSVPPLPPGVDDALLQRPEDGLGPLFHRSYRTQLCEARMDAAELVARIARNPNWVSPAEVASFRKMRGRTDAMDVGDEYLIRMPGPWDGPVRVVGRSAVSFRFATLAGHLEAGQIEFRAGHQASHVTFEIESWARSGDALSAFLYDRLHLAKEMQLSMWTHFLQRVAQGAGARMVGGIHVLTERSEDVHDGR